MALPAKQQANTIRAYLTKDSVKKQLMLAIPKHMNVDRLLRVATTSILKTPKLTECSLPSLLGAIMVAGQLGLEPDGVTGQAYLVPYFNSRKGTYECQLIPGYRGLIALARRSGEITKVSAQVVYENDYFEVEFGTEDKLVHKPEIRGERGAAIGAYAVFHFRDGGAPAFDFMSSHDIEQIAMRSATYDKKTKTWSGPWKTDPDEMRKKTVIKRTSKLQPISIEFQTATELENRYHAGESQMDMFDANAPIDVPAEPQEQIEDETEEEDPIADRAFEQVRAVLPPDQQQQMSTFVEETAAANGCTEDKVRESVTDETKDAFLGQFRAWLESRKSASPPPERPTTRAEQEPAPISHSEQPQGDSQEQHDWEIIKNLKTKGFTTWMDAFWQTVPEKSPWMKQRLGEKCQSIFDMSLQEKLASYSRPAEAPESEPPLMVSCPNDGGEMKFSEYCNSTGQFAPDQGCRDREGCPSWPTE